MSISNVASATQAQRAQQQLLEQFQAVGSALQSGNLSSAQTAFSSFQKTLESAQASGAQLFGQNTQTTADFQNLTTDLKAGDITGAQKAFASLQSDLANVPSAHHHPSQSYAAATTTHDFTAPSGYNLSVGGLNMTA